MLDRLVDDFGDRVYRFIRRLAGPEHAEDLTQETFLKALKALDSYRGGRQDAWLFSIAHGVCIDHLRRRTREREKLRLVCDDRSPSAPPEELARAEDRERILEAVAALPVEQRQVFLLREEGTLTFREIAELTGAPLGTVLARMRYALDNLKKKIPLRETPHELSRV